MGDTRPWTGPERRTNLRLRALIDEHRLNLRDARDAIEYLRERIFALTVEVEVLRRDRAAGTVAGEPRARFHLEN